MLADNGHADTAYRLLLQESCPSWLYAVKKGATTIWEHWRSGSHCHPMFGAPARQLFSGILGIKPLAPGFEEYEIKPQLPASMNYAKGFITTPRGKLTVEVKRVGNEVEVVSSLG